jgi:hypothetical protein
MTNTYYRLHTSDGSLTLRAEEFRELHELMIDTPRNVFDLQLGTLGRVRSVDWSVNGADWVPMPTGVVAASFARVILHWSREPLAIFR